MFIRLMSSRCQSKMRGNRAGALEASGIIDSSLEGQSGNRADTRHSHHAHAYVIVACRAFDPPVKFQKVLIQHEPRIKEWHQRMCQTGPVAVSCRPKCSFKPLSVRKRRGFSSPMLSGGDADCRSR